MFTRWVRERIMPIILSCSRAFIGMSVASGKSERAAASEPESVSITQSFISLCDLREGPKSG